MNKFESFDVAADYEAIPIDDMSEFLEPLYDNDVIHSYSVFAGMAMAAMMALPLPPKTTATQIPFPSKVMMLRHAPFRVSVCIIIYNSHFISTVTHNCSASMT